MKAAVLEKPDLIENNPLQYKEVDKPEPKEGDLLLKVLACGVCLTDKHICEGEIEFIRSPIIPGHQVVGIIEKVGKGVSGYKIGRRVGIMWLHETCRHCGFCDEGRENLCFDAKFSGYHVNGGYADYALVKADYAAPLPEGISDETASPLLCAGIVGYRSYKLSRIKPGRHLGLYGFGAAAHIVIQVARHFDCKVSVFTRSRHHKDLAKKMGATYVGDADDEIDDLLDSGIIFAPAGELVPKALRHLKRGGTLAVNAIHTSDIPSFPYKDLYYEKNVLSVSHATRDDAKEFMKLAAEIPVEAKTETFPLKEANKALLAVKHSKIDGSAVLIP